MRTGKNQSTRRKTSRSKERTNNKLNPHMTLGPGIEPGPHWWGRGGGGGRKTGVPEEKPLGARREPTTNSTHIWRWVRESNPGHIGGGGGEGVGGRPEYPKKHLSEQGENQQQTQLTNDAGSGIRTRATLAGGERSHHCATLSPQRKRSTQQSMEKTTSVSSRGTPIEIGNEWSLIPETLSWWAWLEFIITIFREGVNSVLTKKPKTVKIVNTWNGSGLIPTAISRFVRQTFES